ncbi:uncharacterized [Tachysurus ichikawai]
MALSKVVRKQPSGILSGASKASTSSNAGPGPEELSETFTTLNPTSVLTDPEDHGDSSGLSILMLLNVGT